jgi:hypothetical protein
MTQTITKQRVPNCRLLAGGGLMQPGGRLTRFQKKNTNNST